MVAVAAELKKQRPGVRVVYVGQRGDTFATSLGKSQHIDEVRLIYAGKFRRYHGEGWKQWLDVPTLAKNLRDLIFVCLGFWQSYWLLRRVKPEAIFVKGGFVGLPVGLAAALRKIPYITHDSDAAAGLTNRLLARWAAWHAVAWPKEIYNYPPESTINVGVPVGYSHSAVSASQQNDFRRQLEIPVEASVLLVTGGGLGAKRINGAVWRFLPALLEELPNLYVLHIAGKKNLAEVRASYKKLSAEGQGRVVLHAYVDDFYRYSGAADVVVTRAGATSLAEFALQGKACIVVPNPSLAGGHQLKNARLLSEQGAVIAVAEEQLSGAAEALEVAIKGLLTNSDRRRALGRKLSQLAKPDAARDLAELILKASKRP